MKFTKELILQTRLAILLAATEKENKMKDYYYIQSDKITGEGEYCSFCDSEKKVVAEIWTTDNLHLVDTLCQECRDSYECHFFMLHGHHMDDDQKNIDDCDICSQFIDNYREKMIELEKIWEESKSVDELKKIILQRKIDLFNGTTHKGFTLKRYGKKNKWMAKRSIGNEKHSVRIKESELEKWRMVIEKYIERKKIDTAI